MKIEVKNKKMFKDKKSMIFFIIMFILIIAGFIAVGNNVFVEDELDSIRFSKEFKTVKEENVFEYKNAKEVYEKLNGDVIILFGSSKDKWTEPLAYYLNNIAMSNNIDSIYYYDYFLDRTNNNGNYELIVNKLEKYLYKNDSNKTEIYSPLLVVIKDGEVIYSFDETSFNKALLKPEHFWNDYKVDEFTTILNQVFMEYND